MCKTQLEIFENRAQTQAKNKFHLDFLGFANTLMTKKTIKDVVRVIKEEAPKILGYSACQVFLGSDMDKTLYTLSTNVDENADKTIGVIEREYIIPNNLMVKFPDNLGYSGYAYLKNSICI